MDSRSVVQVIQQDSKEAPSGHLQLAKAYLGALLKNCESSDSRVIYDPKYPDPLLIEVSLSDIKAAMRMLDRLSSLIDLELFALSKKLQPSARIGSTNNPTKTILIQVTHIPSSEDFLRDMLKQEEAHPNQAEADIDLISTLPEPLQESWSLFSDDLCLHIIECMMAHRMQTTHRPQFRNMGMHGFFSRASQLPSIPVKHPNYEGNLNLLEVLASLEKHEIPGLAPLPYCPIDGTHPQRLDIEPPTKRIRI